MLITFNPKTMSATMFSVPRDTYVQVTCSGNTYKKINSAAYGGSKCMINTLEQWTGETPGKDRFSCKGSD